MDGGAWWAAVHGVAQSQTRLKRLSSSNIGEEEMEHSRKTKENQHTQPQWKNFSSPLTNVNRLKISAQDLFFYAT